MSETGDTDTTTSMPAGETETPDASPTATTPKRSRAKKPRKAVKAGAKGAPRDQTKARSTAQLARFPRHSVERALRIPKAIYEQNAGAPATPKEAVAFTGGSSLSGAFTVELSSGKKYGFLDSGDAGTVVLTQRARQAIAPQSESDRVNALREAVLAAPDISAVYNFYRGENLPDAQFLINALADRFRIPADKVSEFLEVFYESIRSAELLDESGERPRLIDIGRDEAHKPAPGKPAGVAVSVPATGNTCFVMQPFAGPLGSYYELVFKPAIEQAGLVAVRADAEIFGTGKIIDQIWRGIRSAKVLVAELTTKNPNVFYELGLAHALQKPVILVSSNQEDVPFDLRHIRVILYDQTDPFWGSKLTDKIADNIKSAVTNPEDAIFRIDEV